jgi:hypothetical protein
VWCRRGSCLQAAPAGIAAPAPGTAGISAPQAKGFEGAANSGERQGQRVRDAPEGAALMAQGDGALQMPWIEHPQLAAENTASIHRVSSTTGAVTAQSLVGRAQADSNLHGEISQTLGILNV